MSMYLHVKMMGDLFIIYKVSKNVTAQINIECIITEVQEILKPQTDKSQGHKQLSMCVYVEGNVNKKNNEQQF